MSLLFSNLFLMILLTYLGKSFLSFRFKSKKVGLIIFTITYCLMSFVNYRGVTNLSAILVLILFITYVLVMFSETIFKKLMIIIPFYTVIAIAEITTGFFMSLYMGLNESTSVTSLEYIYSLIISNFFVYILIEIYIKTVNFFNSVSLPKYAWFIFSLPIATILFVVNIPNYYDLFTSNISFVITLFAIFIANIVYIIIFINLIRNLSLKNEIKLREYKEKLMLSNFNLLNQQYKSNYNFHHNLLNICKDLNCLLEEKKYNDLKTELNTLMVTAFKEFNNIYSNSVVLNTLINNRSNTIKENNINIFSTIECNDFDFINFSDQIDIFSILLDTAIAQVIELPDQRNIFIKSEKVANKVVLQFKFYGNNEHIRNEITLKLNSFLEKYNAILSISIPDFNNVPISIIIAFFDI